MTTGCYTNFVVLADVTGDHQPDVFFANGGDYYAAGKSEPSVVYFNAGGGVFSDVTGATFASPVSRLRQVAVGDVDGDGMLDVYLPGGYGIDPDRLFVQGPAGTFTDRAATLLPAALASRAGAAHFGDVDADGDLDLVVTDWGATPDSWMNGKPLPALLHLYLNDGKGAFTAAPDAAIPAPPDGKIGNTPIDVDLVDVNGDFALDLVVDCRNGKSRLLLNDGKGTFTDADLPVKKGPYSYNIEACDIDGDGDLDLLIDNAAANTGHSTQILINDGTGVFGDESTRVVGEPKSDDNIVKCADVDGDGHFDLVVGSLSWTSEKLLLNDGTAHFTYVADAIPKITDPTLGLDVADVDGDGILDFVTGQGEATPRLNRFYRGSGASQPDTHAPVFRAIEAAPVATAGQPIAIRVAVSDSHTSEVGQQVAEVSATWDAGGGPQKVPAKFVGGDLFRAVIPAQAGGATIAIVLSAKDAQGNAAKSDPIMVTVTGTTGAGGTAGAAGSGGAGAIGGAAGTSAMGGAAGSTAAAGSPAAAGTGGAPASAGASGSAAPPPASSSGCGCSVPANAASVGWLAGVLVALAAIVRRRRARRALQAALEEREERVALAVVERDPREIGVEVRDGEPEPRAAALLVEGEHLAERTERAVVEVGRRPRDTAEARDFEEPGVDVAFRRRAASAIGIEDVAARLRRDTDARELGSKEARRGDAARQREPMAATAPCLSEEEIEPRRDVLGERLLSSREAVERGVVVDEPLLERDDRGADALGAGLAERGAESRRELAVRSDAAHDLVPPSAHVALDRDVDLSVERRSAAIPEMGRLVGDVPEAGRVSRRELRVERQRGRIGAGERVRGVVARAASDVASERQEGGGEERGADESRLRIGVTATERREREDGDLARDRITRVTVGDEGRRDLDAERAHAAANRGAERPGREDERADARGEREDERPQPVRPRRERGLRRGIAGARLAGERLDRAHHALRLRADIEEALRVARRIGTVRARAEDEDSVRERRADPLERPRLRGELALEELACRRERLCRAHRVVPRRRADRGLERAETGEARSLVGVVSPGIDRRPRDGRHVARDRRERARLFPRAAPERGGGEGLPPSDDLAKRGEALRERARVAERLVAHTRARDGGRVGTGRGGVGTGRGGVGARTARLVATAARERDDGERASDVTRRGTPLESPRRSQGPSMLPISRSRRFERRTRAG